MMKELEFELNDHVKSAHCIVTLKDGNTHIKVLAEVLNEYGGTRTEMPSCLIGANFDEVVAATMKTYKEWLATSQEDKLTFKPHQKMQLVVKGERIFDPIMDYIKSLKERV